MPNSDFIPSSDHDLLVWAANLHAKLAANPAAHGVTAEEVATLGAASDDFHAKNAAVAEINTTAKRITAEKDKSRAILVALARRVARGIKGHEGFDEAEGADLGIVGRKTSFDPAAAKPVLSGIDMTDGTVELRFPKLGTEGVNIYCQREGDTVWVLVGHANHSPFTDRRPLLVPGKAELRRYTAIYVINDKEIGHFSDTLEISCAP
jgi:hypothetical protein